MTVIITQETANLVDTLARAASQVGSTAASAKINQLIVDLLPATGAEESIAEALRQDNIALQLELTSVQNSARTMADNLELLRGKMTEITLIAREALPHMDDVNIADDFRKILTFSDPEYAVQA